MNSPFINPARAHEQGRAAVAAGQCTRYVVRPKYVYNDDGSVDLGFVCKLRA